MNGKPEGGTPDCMFETDRITEFPDSFHGGVVAIGNFDGVHRGHAALLAAARSRADAQGLPLIVLTFEPHPRRLFQPDGPPFRITPPAVKTRRLAGHGVDAVISLRFDWDFASQSAENFMEKILRQGIGAGPLYVGHDFRFGQLRTGTPDGLRTAGFDVTVLDAVADEGDSIYSSSRIREHIRAGEMAQASDLLGWPWDIEGMVFRGDRRGRELGYPTANVMLGETIHPAYGIYAAWVRIVGEEGPWHVSATNIGIRPMFEVPTGQVEAHILDFEGDIYGRVLRIRPVALLRGEARFETIPALVAQIGADCGRAKEVLEKESPPSNLFS